MTIFKNEDLEINENESLLRESKWLPQLSYKERVTGFMVCVVIGVMIQLWSMGGWLGLLTLHPDRLALCFSLGNLVQLGGSFFLIGPGEQLHQMFHSSRLKYTLPYLLSILATLLVIAFHSNFLIVTSTLAFQFFAFLFYVFSYIPQGTSCLSSFFSFCFGRQKLTN